jgi:hypothetical protein
MAIAILSLAGVAAGQATRSAPMPLKTPPPRTPSPGQKSVDITPMEALRLVYAEEKYDLARMVAYRIIFDDMYQPEAVYYAASALEKLKDTEQAAAFAHYLLRMLDEPKCKDEKQADRFRKWAQARLKVLDVDFRKQQEQYKAAAAGKKFTKPEQVSDLWMTMAAFDLRNMHGLYAWKQVGGRKDIADADKWIHNTQGLMHRSGAKLMEEVHGRKGVLFSVPLRKSRETAKIVMTNFGKCQNVRIGTRAYGFSFVLNVVVEGKQLFSQTVGTDKWEDLKVPLGEHAGKGVDVTVELVVPEEQQWSEGAWFDYVDFFDD